MHVDVQPDEFSERKLSFVHKAERDLEMGHMDAAEGTAAAARKATGHHMSTCHSISPAGVVSWLTFAKIRDPGKSARSDPATATRAEATKGHSCSPLPPTPRCRIGSAGVALMFCPRGPSPGPRQPRNTANRRRRAQPRPDDDDDHDGLGALV